MRELRLKRNEIFGNRVTLITVYRDEVEQMRLCKRACYFYLLVNLMIEKNLLRIETKKNIWILRQSSIFGEISNIFYYEERKRCQEKQKKVSFCFVHLSDLPVQCSYFISQVYRKMLDEVFFVSFLEPAAKIFSKRRNGNKLSLMNWSEATRSWNAIHAVITRVTPDNSLLHRVSLLKQ